MSAWIQYRMMKTGITHSSRTTYFQPTALKETMRVRTTNNVRTSNGNIPSGCLRLTVAAATLLRFLDHSDFTTHYPCTSPMSFTTGPSNAGFTMNREFDLVSFCDKLLSNLEHDLAPRMTFFKELEGLFGFLQGEYPIHMNLDGSAVYELC
ncbi:MAG: hypothetical protein K0S79_506 [Nitrospira sp.]|jgi:hypothetical protein|nr:hypothetical protein [Nitrospira sp.]